MAAFRDDMPLIAGVDAAWDDMNTYKQVNHPDADISPIRMKTMHHTSFSTPCAQNVRIAQY